MSVKTTRIAHLSDLHLLEPNPDGSRSYGFDVRFVSLGRKLDARERMRKVTRALEAAQRAGVDHVVVSGDLTETGTARQFEAVAEVFHDSRIPPSQVTMVPGNHDAYTAPRAWREALDGPLRAYAETSAHGPGAVVERPGFCILPIDVACHQPVTRSSGELSMLEADALERRLRDPAFSRKAVVVVQHHPPNPHRVPAWQWIDGLRGWARMMKLLEQNPEVQVLHGHLHYAVNRMVVNGRDRIFGAPAVVSDKDDAVRVRLYEVRDGVLESAGLIAA
ncbi:metallophosphoesterase family protein [Pendulispora albinea]|uniref:Metallophosphoesterase n=1 Tax=Pendulispora albinea TaxID=2741071 RepID=A0ABZ2M5P5_9BACT